MKVQLETLLCKIFKFSKKYKKMMEKTYKKQTLVTTNLDENPLTKVLQEYNYSLNEGDIIAGSIFSREKHGLIINIGGSHCAYLPKDETVNWSQYQSKKVINQKREFCIVRVTCKGDIIVSIKKLESIQSWERIKQLYSEDVTVLGKITTQNKGGVLVDIEGIAGFVPNSHGQSTKEIDTLIKDNSCLPLKFLEINEKSGYILLSYKRVILQMYNNSFNVGKIVKGVVTNIKPYGVFVDIGNASGLLHISEISDKHINNLEEIFQIGNEILVSIIHLDTKQGRISLSTKFLS